MQKISTITTALETWAPKASQQSYDNVGLQVGDAEAEISRAVVALDLTPAVVDEAIETSAKLIITHHPLIFRPQKSITTADWNGSLLLKLAKADVALYCIHTNLDAARDGVSFALAERLGLQRVQFLRQEVVYEVPQFEQPTIQTGMGAIGELETVIPLTVFLKQAANALSTDALRYTGDLKALIRRVAVCGGSGSDLIGDAFRAGADAYLTADVTYHRFFEVLDTDGRPRMALIDAMHYETEACTETLLVDWLRKRFTDVDWQKTRHRTSPVHTFVA